MGTVDFQSNQPPQGTSGDESTVAPPLFSPRVVEQSSSDQTPPTFDAWPFDKSERQPFVTVRLPPQCQPRIVSCPSLWDGKTFAKELSSASERLGGSPLLDAIRYAVTNELYLGAFAFFDWIYQPSPWDADAVFLPLAPGHPLCPAYCGFPVIDLCAPSKRAPGDRADDLARAFDGLAAAEGNDPRYWFMRTIAFALARHYGLTGEYEKGISCVDRTADLPLREMFGHLEACRHVLDLKRQGLPVPPRLEKFAGADNRYLAERTCTHPYKRVDINPEGTVYMCCGMWAPLAYGNIVKQDTESVLNSPEARKTRQSMLDGSFRYCNHLHCSVMIQDRLPKKSDQKIMADPVMRAALEDNVTSASAPAQVTFGLDNTCNLSCPSCRTQRIVQKESEHAHERAALDHKLKELVQGAEVLYLNPCGEFLTSRPSRALLSSIDPTANPDLRIDLISNGTLFSEGEWAKFSNVHPLVHTIRISTDAATGPTFEAIRRLGKWPIFLANIKYIGRLRAQGRIKEFVLAYTYQVGNLHEMKAFVELSKEVGADSVSFQRLEKTDAMTDQEYTERAVHYPRHRLYEEFLQIIDDDIFKQKRVRHDFDFPRERPETRRFRVSPRILVDYSRRLSPRFRGDILNVLRRMNRSGRSL